MNPKRAHVNFASDPTYLHLDKHQKNEDHCLYLHSFQLKLDENLIYINLC